MTRKVEDIAKLLPEGLSDTGIEEINSMLEEVVEARVSQETQLLEAKVAGFIRTKIDDLRGEAERELMENNDYARAYQVYQSLKSVISEDMCSADSDSAVSVYKEENAKLHNAVEELNNRLSEALIENETLGSSVDTLTENVKEIEEEKKLPFKSSEKAVVITNEGRTPTSQNPPNGFLSEEVLRLSKALNNN
jgi:uncharacterized membrane protein YheB (UPF0754 family)